MGRPRKDPSEKLSNMVTVLMNNDLYLSCLRAADLQNLNMSSYIRQAIEEYSKAVFEMHGERVDEIYVA